MRATTATPRLRRSRPSCAAIEDNRERLLRSGLEVLTEKGFTATGLDELLGRVGVPKGSFYYYFSSKEAFGLALIERYAAFFARKIDRRVKDIALPPLARLQAFVADAQAGMARFDFRRGCLIGNLGQEMGSLPESFRDRLESVFEDWQRRFAECLDEAKAAGQLAEDADVWALAACFWIGWEGAVLRAKLTRSPEPLELFARFFFAGLPRR